MKSLLQILSFEALWVNTGAAQEGGTQCLNICRGDPQEVEGDSPIKQSSMQATVNRDGIRPDKTA